MEGDSERTKKNTGEKTKKSGEGKKQEEKESRK